VRSLCSYGTSRSTENGEQASSKNAHSTQYCEEEIGEENSLSNKENRAKRKTRQSKKACGTERKIRAQVQASKSRKQASACQALENESRNNRKASNKSRAPKGNEARKDKTVCTTRCEKTSHE
jgi:hypothetical protein